MSRSAIVLYVPTRQLNRYRQAAACPRAARKSATYRSPRSPILAALVPSVGTMTLQIEFGWRTGAMTPGHPALPTDPCVSSRARPCKFEHHNDRTSVKTNSTCAVSTHGWYAMEDDGNLSSGPFPVFEACVARISQPTNGTTASKLQRGPN